MAARGEGLAARGGSVAALARVAPAAVGTSVLARLVDAAREALERGAPEIAASYARRALAEPPAAGERAALLLMLGTAEWRAGQPAATAHLEQALASAGEDTGTLIAASTTLALAYNVSDRAERAVGVLEQLLSAVGDTNAGLALTIEAAGALVGMNSERTAQLRYLVLKRCAVV